MFTKTHILTRINICSCKIQKYFVFRKKEKRNYNHFKYREKSALEYLVNKSHFWSSPVFKSHFIKKKKKTKSGMRNSTSRYISVIILIFFSTFGGFSVAVTIHGESSSLPFNADLLCEESDLFLEVPLLLALGMGRLVEDDFVLDPFEPAVVVS